METQTQTDLFALASLVASVLFILGLKGLSSPVTARRGNAYAITGMAIAVGATLLNPGMRNYWPVLAAVGVGAAIGIPLALRIPMTAMPELVAALHSFVGLTAVVVDGATVLRLAGHGALDTVTGIEVFIGTFVGAITLSGSVIAFGKLRGTFASSAVVFKGQHALNLVLFLVMTGLGIGFVVTGNGWMYGSMALLALILGVTLIIPIGGADMPVVVSVLNSYSGWSASAIGFTLDNTLLIVTGALVGASGAILSYIMCRAMNRSIWSVLLGGFGATASAAADTGGTGKLHKEAGVEDAAYMLKQAQSVVIVPGYGMAVSQAQHAVHELSEMLGHLEANVRYAIHPVAGRMPGHMNVLLAEAGVPYEQVLELEDINGDFSTTDVVLVIGANDIVNPAAKTDTASPIYGMPILEVSRARLVFAIKRSMRAGYAGIDNRLYVEDNTMMLFGDAKEVCERLVAAMK